MNSVPNQALQLFCQISESDTKVTATRNKQILWEKNGRISIFTLRFIRVWHKFLTRTENTLKLLKGMTHDCFSDSELLFQGKSLNKGLHQALCSVPLSIYFFNSRKSFIVLMSLSGCQFDADEMLRAVVGTLAEKGATDAIDEDSSLSTPVWNSVLLQFASLSFCRCFLQQFYRSPLQEAGVLT